MTKTEQQGPTTVTAILGKDIETVKVPDEKTGVVKAQPGEPTTVRETITEMRKRTRMCRPSSENRPKHSGR
ncbi:hypothetical protein [Corynebacterium sp. HMSC064E08]|uniref:hypothetical protein n=1 Tax=Corynebacterium sp. HMSC064E08 TaxID=1739324 RepID=UPI0008A1B4C1|nr:hypothetical protein [Corynebacterium sp. HMSC064E08]OFK33263.1 hypothetical protein HMPREF2820_04475 [Corynebacterium sp. HMSC064E08]